MTILHGREVVYIPIYNKLVRDKIPETIRQDHKRCTTKVLDTDRYKIELKKKSDVEIQEYKQATTDEQSLEELADVLEIMHALAETHGASFDKVEEFAEIKLKNVEDLKRKFFSLRLMIHERYVVTHE